MLHHVATGSRARTSGVLAVSAVALALALGACSGGSTKAASPNGGGQAPGRFTPRVSGLIAADSDGTLQVQGSNGQTEVRYTDATTVTKTVTINAAQIAVGNCVTAVLAAGGSASSVAVTAATANAEGTCGPAGGGQGGNGFPTGRPSGFPSGRPSGFPSGRPSGFPSGGPRGGGGFTSGLVTAVGTGTMTVRSIDRNGAQSTVDVTLTAGTVVTTMVAATANDIAVGLCVVASGAADTAGGYDATALALSTPDGNGACTGGRGGFGGGGR